ncbi:unnamed protein product [Nezara viridula]|uniref:Uncharacterized protein n=1 Tax=Nezara viridula TaxID=85310 RepID=A0A9P0MV10_NEZVI|nr:unnamed protein product [Nezara viridula]
MGSQLDWREAQDREKWRRIGQGSCWSLASGTTTQSTVPGSRLDNPKTTWSSETPSVLQQVIIGYYKRATSPKDHLQHLNMKLTRFEPRALLPQRFIEKVHSTD